MKITRTKRNHYKIDDTIIVTPSSIVFCNVKARSIYSDGTEVDYPNYSNFWNLLTTGKTCSAVATNWQRG